MSGIVGIDVGGTFTDLYYSGGSGQGGKMVTVFPKAAVLPGVTLKPLGRP